MKEVISTMHYTNNDQNMTTFHQAIVKSFIITHILKPKFQFSSIYLILESQFLKIDIKYLIVMEDIGKPDPRWEEFIEEMGENGKVIGFKLPNNDFLFKYEEDGGWEDEKGNYYNADGILEVESEKDSVEDELDEDLSSEQDEFTVETFEKLLREEEEGVKQDNKQEKKQENKQVEFDFQGLLEKYKAKEKLREGLPDALFIYFKQKTDKYEIITPIIEKLGSTGLKNAAVKQIQEKIEKFRKKLQNENDWLKEDGVYLDYSGESEKENLYERYWFGSIRTSPNKYLQFIEKIKKSKEFKILKIKTFYALKSKFYLKKAEQEVKQNISQLKAKIDPLDENMTVSLLIDRLPEQFPCSFIYDLVEYAGGKIEQVESVIIEDDFSATITCLKPTALSLINIEGYNHDKGEFIEIGFNEAKNKAQGKPFNYITVDSEYKIHESELHDTLALELSKTGIAKHLAKDQEQKDNVRFVVGSIDTLKRVLMYRGVTLNIVRVLSSIPK